MSTLRSQTDWDKISNQTTQKSSQHGKYEKCRHITEEIYKRIDLTFKIKKLEAASQSDLSDESDPIDSNDLSNETDLFACDKSSLSSSTDLENLELGNAACEKYINNNNNEETKLNKKTIVPYKRPKKRFRKRVKKQQKSKPKDSDGSSDEDVSCNRVVDIDVVRGVSPPASLDNVMGIPNIVIVACDFKTKTLQKKEKVVKNVKAIDPEAKADSNKQTYIDMDVMESNIGWLLCDICKSPFRGERGLRRHIKMSHQGSKETGSAEERDKN